MNGAYYNEIDPFAAQWLRNLIAAGHIAPGDVDERSIVDVRADDLRGYVQCHFFAGIGIWSEALRTAGWPDDEPVWTGSCPCQPFSAAGFGAGFDDPRHLWPTWGALIAQRGPGVCFGEQVADKDGLAWLDLVWADLEEWGYAFGPLVLPAAGFGAPHGRHRIFFVADAERERVRGGGLGTPETAARRGEGQNREREWFRADAQPGREALACAVGDTERGGREELRRDGHQLAQDAVRGRAVGGFWANAAWVNCLDGKARPFEPASFPLADGTPARVGRVRAYGNAIVAPVAAEFIRAYRETR